MSEEDIFGVVLCLVFGGPFWIWIMVDHFKSGKYGMVFCIFLGAPAAIPMLAIAGPSFGFLVFVQYLDDLGRHKR